MRAPAAQPRLLRLPGAQALTRSRPERDGRSALSGQGFGGGRALVIAALVCVGLAAVSLLGPATPTYDPWAWLLWGREIIHLDLNTAGGPSWKPLPVLFTIPFSLVGHGVAPYLWLVVARAGGLMACFTCFRVGSRLGGGGLTGALGGLAAALLLLTSFNFVRDSALGNSEALMVALVLLAFERHLDGRRDHALYFGFAAALLRPEVWPFLGLYGVFLILREPAMRLRTAVLGALVPVLWLGPELWGSGQALRAATRANDPNRGSAAFAKHPTVELLHRFGDVLVTPVKIGAAVAVAYGLYHYVRRRREGPLLLLFLAGCAWFALVAAMTEAGYAGNQRYLIISTTAFTVLAGVGAARALEGVSLGASRLVRNPRAGMAAVLLCAVAVVIAELPLAHKKANSYRETLRGLRYESSLWPELKQAIKDAGGRDRLRACGGIFSGPYQTQMVAYELRVHGESVRSLQGTPPPGVAFRTRTIPRGPLVIKLTDKRFRQIARHAKWRVLTVPPAGRSSCPAAGPNAPRAPSVGRGAPD